MHTLLNIIPFPFWLALGSLPFMVGTLSGQVELSVALGPDGQTYTVSARSQVDLLPPLDHVLHEAETTLVAPAGGLEVAALENQLGEWELSHLIQHPAENPGADYMVFRLIGAAGNGAFPAGEEVPLFSFQNTLGCTGALELMGMANDPFSPPNSLGLPIGHTFFAEGINGNAYAGNYAAGLADCTRFSDCSLQLHLQLLPTGKYQISLLTADTLAAGTRLGLLRVALKVPAHFFQLHELTNLQFGALDFMGISRNDSPVEAPGFDYLQFRLKADDPDGFPLSPGDTLPLISFGNGGSCGGDSIFLVKYDDDFRPPNSQAADIGQQVFLSGNDLPQGICLAGSGAAECLACAFSDEIIDIDEVATTDPILCLGTDNGTLRIFGTGAENMEYSIDGGTTWTADGTFDSLSIGTYQPAVRGQYFGCEATTLADPVELVEETTFQLQLDIPTTICESDDLALQIMSPSPLPMGTIYVWAGPAGFTAATADPAIFSIQAIQSGTYSLTVEAPGCDPATATATTTVTPLPELPTLLTNAPICEGDTLELSTDVEGMTFEWLGPAGQSPATLALEGLTTASGQTRIPPGHPAYLPGDWQVRVSNAGGCFSQSGTKEILIKNRPQAFAENDGPVCLGKPATLSANPLAGAEYRWRKMGEPTVFSTQKDVTLPSVTSQTTFELEVEMDGCPSENTATTTVALHPKPASYPTFEYEPAEDCSPQNIELTANGNGLGLTYDWSGANGFSSQVENPVIGSATAAANGSYQLMVTNMYGCTATSPFQINGVVDALPTPVVQSTGTVCPGENMVLSVDGFANLPASFSWKKNGSNIFGATAGQLELAAVDASDVALYGVEIQVGNCAVASDELLVTVLEPPLPEPAFVLPFPCEGTTLQFFSNEENITAWQWSGPNGFTASSANPLIYNAAFDEVGTYSLTVTGANGCTATDEVLVDGILPIPDLPEVATNSPVCPGTATILTVQNPVALGSVFYEWTNGAGMPIGTGGPVLQLAPDDPAAIPPYLVRVDVNTCLSETTDPIMVEELPQPVADAGSGGAVCPGGETQLFAVPVPDATYEWRIAGQPSVFSFEQNPTVTLADTTTFELTVTTAECGIQVTDMTTVFTKTKPLISNLTGGGSFCEGAFVQLSAQNSAPLTGDIYYTWSGPAGFSYTASAPATSTSNLNLGGVELTDAGAYTLQITSADGCLAEAESVLVEVVEMPGAPVLFVEDSLLCQGEVLQLDATAYTGSFVQYDWYFSDGTTDALVGSTSYPTFFLENINPSQSGFYFVKIDVDGCVPPPSNLEPVEVKSLPANIEAVSSAPATGPVCEGEAVQLEVPFIAGAAYDWAGPAGFHAAVHNPELNEVSLDEAGEYLVEITFENCDLTRSAEATVHIAPRPGAPILSGPLEVCEATDVAIEVTNAEPGAVYDFYFSENNTLVETGGTPEFILQNVIPAQSGGYHAVAALGECLSANGNAHELTVRPRETDTAFAGTEQVICAAGEVVFLSGNTPTEASGKWLSLDGGIALQSQSPNSEVQNFRPGENRFVWEWEHPICGQFSSDTTSVFLEKLEAVPDVLLAASEDNPLEINILENDFTEQIFEWEAKVTSSTDKGQVKIADNEVAVYSPWPNVFGEDGFVYELCSITCPEVCDTASVRLILAGSASAADCFTPNLITPNGDGENDTFIVPCAAQWPGSSLTIFNRYGSTVFEVADYANDWDGTYKNEPLPNGTYFFHLALRDGEGSVLTGYVVLNR